MNYSLNPIACTIFDHFACSAAMKLRYASDVPGAAMPPFAQGSVNVRLRNLPRDSNFEIDTDANLRVDDAAPSIDWANVGEVRKPDLPSGAADDSFGQGTKEDTAVPTVVDGSIPPNKSDLLNFGVYLEETAAGRFLHVFWHRVQEPQGTTNMDFELNQSATPSANGVTPVRTAGDLLLTYDLAKGGTTPILSKREWTGTAWGPVTDLSAGGVAVGSINTSAIPATDGAPVGAQDARTFGEAEYWDGAAWHQWEPMGGELAGPPAASSWGAGWLRCWRASSSAEAPAKGCRSC